MTPRAKAVRSSGHYCVATREGSTRRGFCNAPVTPIPPLRIAPKHVATTERTDR